MHILIRPTNSFQKKIFWTKTNFFTQTHTNTHTQNSFKSFVPKNYFQIQTLTLQFSNEIITNAHIQTQTHRENFIHYEIWNAFNTLEQALFAKLPLSLSLCVVFHLFSLLMLMILIKTIKFSNYNKNDR